MADITTDFSIAIVIPAHNEEKTIADCLTAIRIAIEQLPSSIKAYPLVVLDSCTDNTLERVKVANVEYLLCQYRCVGRVRDKGVRHAISKGATWIACTDADSIVPPDWLLQQVTQLRLCPTDMICGVVDIDSWVHLTAQTRTDYIAHYQDSMGHHHIHGANLSFSSDSYLSTGGFGSLPCHEDVDLVKRFEAHDYHIVWSNKVRVMTSSRLDARTTQGFAEFLSTLEARNTS